MISALVLAGGDSSRMGRIKALLKYDGRTFLEAVCAGAKAAGVTETIVVLGGSRTEVLAAWNPGEVKIAFNDTPELGQIASVRAGLKIVSPKAEAVMICLVDQPTIARRTYKEIVAFWSCHKDFLVIPKCLRPNAAGIGSQSLVAGGLEDSQRTPNREPRTTSHEPRAASHRSQAASDSPLYPLPSTLSYKRGHPIIIPRKHFPLCFDGPDDKGLHWVTHHASVKVLDLVVEDAGVIRDFDTPEEYERMRE